MLQMAYDGTRVSQLAHDFDQDNLYFRQLNTSTDTGTTWEQIFHDTYHPNADKWTSARALTLSGDVTGSVSFDGSGAINMTNAVVGNNSHQHSMLYEQSSIDFGASYLQWTDVSGTGGNGTDGASPTNPTSDWYHHIIANHANNSGYYYDLSLPFHQDELFFRRVTAGVQGTSRKLAIRSIETLASRRLYRRD